MAETEAQSSQQRSDQFAAMSEQHDWSAIAIHPFAGAGLVVGLLAVVLAGFMTTLVQVGTGEQGVAQTAIWFNWIGLTLIAVSLVLGAMISKTAHAGIRVAMVGIGLFVLLSTSTAPGVSGFFPGM